MVISIREKSKKINFMGKVFIGGRMVIIMMVCMLTIKSMERGFMCGKMKISMKKNHFKMDDCKEMEFLRRRVLLFTYF